MIDKAIEIAARAHAGQVDKVGAPYILHPLRVMLYLSATDSLNTKICAILHDVVEDTDITFDDLRAEGFSDEVIAALDCLTKREGESYDDFINRVITNETASRVKACDLADNMDLTRIPEWEEIDEERQKKYEKAADRIMDALSHVDAIPECRYIEIEGVAEIHPSFSGDQFADMFLKFIESQGWYFGGGFKDITDEEE